MSISEDREIQFTKEDYLFLAKIYSKCESFEEMAACMKNIIAIDPVLSNVERNYFSASYKNFLGEKRQRLKVISYLLKKQQKTSQDSITDTKISLLRELKMSLQKEIIQINIEVQGIIDEYLLKENKKKDDIVFYYKMKADYFRYMHEMEIKGENNENYLKLAEQFYKKAFNESKGLPEINFVRLNTALNFAIFLGEVKKNKEEAIEVAKDAFDSVFEKREELEKEENKESIVVVQLIQENLVIWSGGKLETEEEEEEAFE